MDELDAVIHLAFAFDVGYEIDLERARPLLPGESGPLARRRRTPESIRYRPAPLRAAFKAPELALPGGFGRDRPPRAELSIFDFGAVSLAASFPSRSTPEALLELAGALAEPAALNASARALIAPWIERIRPAILEYEASALSEEYIIFQVRDVRDDWLERHAAWVAGLVRLESEPLSAAEVREATRRCLSYSPHDLVVLDWAAGFG